MSFETEWAQIKQEVSGSGTTRLASADDTAAGSSGGVVSDRSAWNSAAGDMETLAGNVTTASNNLRQQQHGLGAMTNTAGAECVGAQSAVYLSWNAYLYNLQARCEALRGRLANAGKAHHGSDREMWAAFNALDDDFDDTPPVGYESGPVS